MGSELAFLDCFLHDPICGSELLDDDSSLGARASGRFISDEDFSSGSYGSDKMDLLSTSLQENGLLLNQNSQQNGVRSL